MQKFRYSTTYCLLHPIYYFMRKIPSHANKVFQGILFSVYQWEQELFDGSTATFEALERDPMADVIPVTPEGNILILEERQPGTDWFPSVPGGHIEKDEDPLLGSQRELLEETGYASDDWEQLFSFPCGGKIFSPIHIYVARNCRKVQEPHLDGGEEITMREVSFDEFLELCRDPRLNTAVGFKFMMYEALLDPRVKQDLRERIFGA